MNRFDENVATLLPGLVAVRREQDTTLPQPTDQVSYLAYDTRLDATEDLWPRSGWAGRH